MAHDDLKSRVARVNYMLYKSGIAFSIWGHASARVPGENKALVKPVQVPFRDVTAEDIVTVDFSGRKVEGKENPPKEIYIHTSIYSARKDVGGIVHAHPKAVTALAALGQPLLPIYNEGSYWFAPTGRIPLFRDGELITTKALGDAVARTLGRNSAVLIKNHGFAVVGTTIEHACIASWYLERLAGIQLLASSVGKPTTLSRADIKTLIDRTPPDYWEKLWQHFAGEFGA